MRIRSIANRLEYSQIDSISIYWYLSTVLTTDSLRKAGYEGTDKIVIVDERLQTRGRDKRRSRGLRVHVRSQSTLIGETGHHIVREDQYRSKDWTALM